jgi:hypothetical protein
MIYCDEPHTTSGGQWWCPFSREWVARTSAAAKRCKKLTCEQIDAAIYRFENGLSFKSPPGDFLKEPQDARGLPLSWCQDEELKYRNHPTCCREIYDYNTIPDVVITNWLEDRPLRIWEPVLRA